MPTDDAIILAALEVYLSYCAQAITSSQGPEELASCQERYNRVRGLMYARRRIALGSEQTVVASRPEDEIEAQLRVVAAHERVEAEGPNGMSSNRSRARLFTMLANERAAAREFDTALGEGRR